MKLFAEIKAGKFKPFTSEYVPLELEITKDAEKRAKMKALIDDYMNDPDIVNEPSALREVHAARLMIQDETKGMTVAERTAYYHEAAVRFLAPASNEKTTDTSAN
ncbi:MAG: hypothetical protein LBI04_08185 [Treponema sp.]|nr:hypothetical protein [Treponema sp.]